MKTARIVPVVLAALAGAAHAQMTPDWIATIPVGNALTAGMQGIVVDDDGNSYITGIGGPSGNTDVVTAAFDPDGNLLWQKTFNGPNDWHDQARGICLAPGGVVYVCGNTPDPNSYANVLVLKYDAATGEQLDVINYTTGPFTSEFGGSIVADDLGNIYVGGGTVGDGSDGLLLSFTDEGDFRWKTTYDGAAFGPFSQDHYDQLLMAPDGTLLARVYGNTGFNHPDFIAHKYDTDDGSLVWEATWGVSGGDTAFDMEVDAAGDVYMTGVGIDFIDKFSTVKFRGTDGALLWQEYDAPALHNVAVALNLDGEGGVYVTGSADPDGDESNFNDNFHTVKRDADTGAKIWEHNYGANCVGCFDAPRDVLVDSEGHALVLGGTSSPPYSADMIIFNLDAATGIEIERGVVGGDPDESAGGAFLRFDGPENIYVGGGYYNVNSGAEGMAVFKFPSLLTGCGADFNGDGVLNILDFVAFQNAFTAGDPDADCNADGALNILDFVCYQNLFQAGCP